MDWATVERDLSDRGVTLKLLWEEWRETHPDGMSHVTWTRRFRDWRPCVDVTMRQNRRPGERLFVDYAGTTVPLFLDGLSMTRRRGVIAGFDQVPQHLPPRRRNGIENQHLNFGKVARGTGRGKAFEDLAADVRSRRIGNSGHVERVGQRRTRMRKCHWECSLLRRNAEFCDWPYDSDVVRKEHSQFLPMVTKFRLDPK